MNKPQKSDQLIGFFATATEKNLVEAAKKIREAEMISNGELKNRSNLSMSAFLSSIILRECRFILMKSKNKNIKRIEK